MGMITPCWTQKNCEKDLACLYQSPEPLLDQIFFQSGYLLEPNFNWTFFSNKTFEEQNLH